MNDALARKQRRKPYYYGRFGGVWELTFDIAGTWDETKRSKAARARVYQYRNPELPAQAVQDFENALKREQHGHAHDRKEPKSDAYRAALNVQRELQHRWYASGGTRAKDRVEWHLQKWQFASKPIPNDWVIAEAACTSVETARRYAAPYRQ